MSSTSYHIIGALAALGSAFCWAISAMLFNRVGKHVSAPAMNLVKGVIALAFMSVFLFVEGLEPVDNISFIVLAISGLIGITLGDTLYFMTLVRLGARVTLVLGTLIPVTTALIAVAFLGERMEWLAWGGILLTLVGVSTVLWEHAPAGDVAQVWRKGVLFGVLFVLANALAIILSKIGVEEMSSMEASFIRQAWAIGGLLLWGVMTSGLGRWVQPVKSKKIAYQLLLASIIGAFLGTWLSIAALKYTLASVAAVLNSTSPLFILPLAMIFLKERPSFRSIVGAVVAVGGIGCYFVALQ